MSVRSKVIYGLWTSKMLVDFNNTHHLKLLHLPSHWNIFSLKKTNLISTCLSFNLLIILI